MTTTAVIVDDHAGFRAMARCLLEDAGFDVVAEAVDGRGELKTVRALRPCLVLLDIQLPDLDGFALAEELSRTTPHTCVVLTSVRSASEYGHRVADAGARGFVPKAELSATILGELLEGAQ